MKIVKCLFKCNLGQTREEVEVEIIENEGSETQQIEQRFAEWVSINDVSEWEYLD